MKNLISAFAVLLIFICISCDENELYDNAPNVEEANMSYENQFKAIWTAIDLNYPIWDYERDEYGLNWDDVYNEYLPKFKELDLKYQQTGDTTCWLSVQELYKLGIFKKLHDGHINFKIKDVYTGKKADLLNYTNVLSSLIYTMGIIIHKLHFSLDYKEGNESGHVLLENKTTTNGYWFGYFSGGIVYLHFPEFKMSEILAKEEKTKEEQDIVDVWKTWFDKIQDLHGRDMLKGVILDVRHNHGGYALDYQYFLGALHGDVDGNKSIRTGFYRMKKGIGRYDYLSNANININGENGLFHSYEKSHAIVNAPIVVLADSMSASTAEHTCLAAKKLKNACVMGTTTQGAFSPLANKEHEDFTFLGNIGDPKLESSSFYIIMPFVAFVTDDGKIIEGKGVEPDIEVFDDDNNRDKQLDTALDYITKLNIKN